MTVGIEICNLENLRIFNGYEVPQKEAKVMFLCHKLFFIKCFVFYFQFIAIWFNVTWSKLCHPCKHY